MTPPAKPKIYHIVHVDRLPSIIADGTLLSDAALQENPRPGTTIGMSEIKQRRLESQLSSRPGVYNMTQTALLTAEHLPEVSVEPRWYY